ncbi:hypothetical protein GOBAR_AA08045 [Gossypium barbadense]|uniref:Uncharacterized protein n=1 Tax=Gossypium barbadense TaxID=3634 RepID=A0A2P5YAG7_GOSBA|nr:hypothetical protein GOBAR_AA08045 [Gossypium barbadense]
MEGRAEFECELEVHQLDDLEKEPPWVNRQKGSYRVSQLDLFKNECLISAVGPEDDAAPFRFFKVGTTIFLLRRFDMGRVFGEEDDEQLGVYIEIRAHGHGIRQCTLILARVYRNFQIWARLKFYPGPCSLGVVMHTVVSHGHALPRSLLPCPFSVSATHLVPRPVAFVLHRWVLCCYLIKAHNLSNYSYVQSFLVALGYDTRGLYSLLTGCCSLWTTSPLPLLTIVPCLGFGSGMAPVVYTLYLPIVAHYGLPHLYLYLPPSLALVLIQVQLTLPHLNGNCIELFPWVRFSVTRQTTLWSFRNQFGELAYLSFEPLDRRMLILKCYFGILKASFQHRDKLC